MSSAPIGVVSRPRGPGPATAAAPGPTGRGSARAGPCRGAAACTRPWRTRRRAGRGARGSAARSARRSGRPAARGRSSASSARAASTGRARRAPCPAPRGSWASTASRRPGSSSAPTRSRTGCRGSRCPTCVGSLVHAPSSPLVIVSAPLPVPAVIFQPRPCASTGHPSGSGPTESGSTGAVALAEGVAADDERDRLLVVHRHAGERLADVARRGERIGVAVRAPPGSRRSGPSAPRRAGRRARGRRCSARRRATCPPGPRRPPRAPRCPGARSRSRTS